MDMASVGTTIPVEEYLRTTYHPDCEYVDGLIVERNVGESKHSRAQRRLIRLFAALEESLRAFAYPELRVQVKRGRFRIPDVTIVLGAEISEAYLTTPPFLVIEVLSPDDRHGDLLEKVRDYLEFGVPYVWVINPESRRGEIYTSEGMRDAADGIMRTADPAIEVPLAEILS